MRLTEFFYLLGLKPSARVYGHSTETVHLEKDGEVKFALWRNPRFNGFEILQSEIDELRTFISDGDVAIDIGAHCGDTALPMALACGPNGFVLAFEPNPFVFSILASNAILNPGKYNIVAFPYAVTNQDEALVFKYNGPDFPNGGDKHGSSVWKHGSTYSLPVEGRRIGPMIRARLGEKVSKLRYIKTDIEGHDLSALKSIEDLVDEARPRVKSEVNVHNTPEERRALYRFFAEKGYAVHLVEQSTLFGRKLAESDMASIRHFDIFAVPE